MAKKNETKSETETARPKSTGSSGSCQSYMLVRTALDSVQFNAINYYVAGTSDSDKRTRANKISAIMKQANAAIEALPKGLIPCHGHVCDGFCVPYECP